MRNWKKHTGRWSRQCGAGIMGWLLGLVAIVVVGTLSLRLGPHYLDFRTLQSVMDSLPAGEVHEMDKNSVRELLQKRFRINSIRDMTVRDIVSIERTQRLTKVKIEYEKREYIMFNIDVVLTFDESHSYQ